jgi:RimJ/RimL family protein N-acetyltransferase
MAEFELRTDRLVLRDWRDADREPFAMMNADPAVMEFFPSTLDPQASDVIVDHFQREFAERGFCPWALELADVEAFIGFVGLHCVPDEMTFSPAVEVGWRLARPFWGQGYATEAATRVLRFGFDELGLEELVSFTSVLNVRSRRVMERLGMSRDPRDDFEHPNIPEGHRLRPHVLYRSVPPHESDSVGRP